MSRKVLIDADVVLRIFQWLSGSYVDLRIADTKALRDALIAAETDPADVAALRADAERYRWLRDQNAIDWDGFPFAPGYEHPDKTLDSYPMMLDAAIDAAMGR